MNESLAELLEELERFGEANDTAHSERARRMLNITRDTGEFLAVLVNSLGARRILEIGTSNGYSTLWLAMATARLGGRVRTLENDAAKLALARRNFERAGLAEVIEPIHDDAGAWLRTLEAGAYDLVFLDANRAEYITWWPSLRRGLRVGGLLVVDNAVSHAEQLRPFLAMVSGDEVFATSRVPVGKGEFLASRLR